MARTKQTARKATGGRAPRRYGHGRMRGRPEEEEEEKEAIPLTADQLAKQARQRAAHDAKRLKQRAERQREIDALPIVVPRPDTLCEETANRAQVSVLVQQWTKMTCLASVHGPPSQLPLASLIDRDLPTARAKLSGEASAMQTLANDGWFDCISEEWPWMPVERSKAWLDRVWPALVALMANCAYRIDELAMDNARHQAEVDAAKAAGLPEPASGRTTDKGLIGPWKVALSLVQTTCTDVIPAKRPYVRPSAAEEADKKARKEEQAKERAANKGKKGAAAAAAAAASSSSSSAFSSSVKPVDIARRTALSIQSMLPFLPELIALTVRVLAAGTASREPSPRHQSLGEEAAFEFLKALLDVPAVRDWLATPAATSAVAALQSACFVALLSMERPFQAASYAISSYLKDVATRESDAAALAAGKKKKRADRWGTKWYEELLDPRIEPDDDKEQTPVSFGVKLLYPLLGAMPVSAGLSTLIWDHCVAGMRRAPAAMAKRHPRPTADNELRACFRGMQALLDLNPACLADQRDERTAELLSLIEPVMLLPAAQESTWLLSQRGAAQLSLRLVSLLAAVVKSARSTGSVLASAVEANCSSVRRLLLRVLRAPTADITRTAQRGVLTLLQQPTTAAIVPNAMMQPLDPTAKDASQHLLLSLLELIESTLFASPSDRTQRASLSHADYGLVQSAFEAIASLSHAQLHPPSEAPNPLCKLRPLVPLRSMAGSPSSVPPLGVRVAQMLIRACETSEAVLSWQMRGASLAALCPHLAALVSRADQLHLAPLLHTLLSDSMRLVLRDSGGEFEEPCLLLRQQCFLAWSSLVEQFGEDADAALDDVVGVLAEVMASDYWAEKKSAEQMAEEKAEEQLQAKKEADREAARAARDAAEEAKEEAEAAAAAGDADGDEEMKDGGGDMKDEDGDGEENEDDEGGDGDDGEENEEDEDEDAEAEDTAAAANAGSLGLTAAADDSSAADTDYSSVGNGWDLSDTAEEPSGSDSEQAPWAGPDDQDWTVTRTSHDVDFFPLYTALLQYGPKRFLYFHDRRLAPMLYRLIRNSDKASAEEQTAAWMPRICKAMVDARKRHKVNSNSISSAAAAAASSSSVLSSLPVWDASLLVHDRAVFWRLALGDFDNGPLMCHLLRQFVALFDLLGDSVFDVPAQPERPDSEAESSDDDDNMWPPKVLTPKQEAAKAKKKAAKEARALDKKNRFEERLATFAEATLHTDASSQSVQTRRLLRLLRLLIRLLEGRLGMQYDRYNANFEGCAELEVRDHHPPPPPLVDADAAHDADDEGHDSAVRRAPEGKAKGKAGQAALKTARKGDSRKKKQGGRGRGGHDDDDDDDCASSPRPQPGPRLPFRFAPVSTVQLHLGGLAPFSLPHEHTAGRCPGGDSCKVAVWIEVRCVALHVLSVLCACDRSRPFVAAAMDGRSLDGSRHGNGSLRDVLDALAATDAFAPAVKQFWTEANMDSARAAHTHAAAAVAAKRR